eukprot:TRINITY_DN16002_c0_g1_i1.p1 TRINITY_DN16002_c0_g1~~TRINITY_DN16002_c0_g1_i1.p1  ORF type:complete len:54 (-),score=8.02 TRINITY_DN16002_c0_g1_i1:59-220(-)
MHSWEKLGIEISVVALLNLSFNIPSQKFFCDFSILFRRKFVNISQKYQHAGQK